MDIVRPKERAKGECDTPCAKRGPTEAARKERGKAGKPVIKGASGRARRDSKSPPVLQGGEDTRKKKVPALSKYELAGDL